MNNNPNYANNNYYYNNNHMNQRRNQNVVYNGFVNNLARKNMNFNNGNDKININMAPGPTNPSPSTSSKKNLKTDLLRAFDAINEDFMYNPPIFIPLIPGNDPYDKYNEEEHL